MTFAKGDHVLWDGYPFIVEYANDDVVVFRRQSDQHLMMKRPDELAGEQVPYVLARDGWWTPIGANDGNRTTM